MAEGGSENDTLGKFVKKHSKYGTTTKSTYTNDKFIKYTVEKGDTLQGISLKQGVTMEDIKRANNIWTNDSLYLRDYLLIPIDEKSASNGYLEINDNNHQDVNRENSKFEIVTRQDIIAAQKMSKSKSCSAQLSTICECPQTEPSAKDFLSRFDNRVAEIKSNISRLECHTSFTGEDPANNPLALLPKKKTQYGHRSTHAKRHSLESDMAMFMNDTTEPELVIVSASSRGNRAALRASLEQLQKTEEDLFQL